jgi:hypothetical protein
MELVMQKFQIQFSQLTTHLYIRMKNLTLH